MTMQRKRSRQAAEKASRAFACSLLTAHFLFLPYGGYERMMEGKYVCFLLLSALYLVWLARSAPLEAPRRTPAALLSVLLLFCSALSSACSPWFAQTLLGGSRRDGLLTLVIYILSFLALSTYLCPEKELLYLTAVSSLLCDTLVLLQLAGRNPLGLYPAGLNYYDGDLAYPGFYAGTSGNIDFTAFLLAISVCVLLAAALRLRLWVLMPIAGITLWVLAGLGVAAAWVGVAAAAVWGLALLFPGKKRELLFFSLCLTAAGTVLLFGYRGNNRTLSEAARLLRGEWDGAFGSGRLAIWRDCLSLVRERPLLGGGPDTLWLRGVEPFQWVRGEEVVPVDITAAHNEYLNLLVNQGAVAAAAYAALLLDALLRCFRRAEEPAFAVCGVGLLCYAAQALFSISTCITAPYVWLLLAVVNAECREA